MPRGGTFLGGGTFGEKKEKISKWPFTDEPEVRFRFRFWIFVKVGPTICPRFGRDCPSLNVCPGVPSRLAKFPGRHLPCRSPGDINCFWNDLQT